MPHNEKNHICPTISITLDFVFSDEGASWRSGFSTISGASLRSFLSFVNRLFRLLEECYNFSSLMISGVQRFLEDFLVTGLQASDFFDSICGSPFMS